MTAPLLLRWWFCIALLSASFASAAAPVLTFQTRSRAESAKGSGNWQLVEQPAALDPQRTALVICDMWDTHTCSNSARRVAEMAPRMNEVVKKAREQGIFIIHCPSDTMKFYEGAPGRNLAQAAPKVEPKVPLQRWCSLDKTKEAPLPIDDSDGGCDSDTPWPKGRPYPWTRQIDTIEIRDGDAITDSAEAYYLMRERGITNVIVMGVHLNMCVLGRPFSIRQMVAQGMNVFLVRDLTDTMYNPRQSPYVPHCVGNDLMVEHVEKFWCPTIASTAFLGGAEFRFKEDQRPHAVFLIGEDEYRTSETLPAFATNELAWRGFRFSIIQQSADNKHSFPGLVEAMRGADLLFVSVRRRALPKQQLDAVRAHLAAGKPLLGIRTASHAFAPRGKDAEQGDSWPTFDPDVLGGNYSNHWGAGPKTTIEAARAAASELLTGVDLAQLTGHGSLYKVSPLKSAAQPLLIGYIPGQPAEPVAWTQTFGPKNARIFYTSLGHWDDFAEPAFRRLLLNAVLWSVAQPIPPAPASPPESAKVSVPDWQPVAVPGCWEDTVPLDYDGLAWYRCFVNLPAAWSGQLVTLAVEAVDNAHEAFLNGAKIGGAGKFPPNYQNGVEAAGRYSLPADKLILGGCNIIAIRVYDHEGRGGFKGLAPVVGTDQQHITLAGPWQFRTGDGASWAREGVDTKPPSATFAKVEDGAAPKPSAGHKMSDRAAPLPPAEAAKMFTVPDGLEIELVLAEPDIAQPVFLNFDERGRMWVVEYRQYPAPAGLTVVSHDKFWRAIYDKVPEPPPRGVKGLDRISIHEDTDGDGRYDKHKVFVDGLNIATSCVKGRGGVWVLNPPYLLFYPDKNDDDVPDGDPEVHLEGFGLEDTHSVVNSLRWGPDGWLYAAQGSTVTGNVRVRAAAPSPQPSPPPTGEREKRTPRVGEATLSDAQTKPASSDPSKTGATVPPLPLRGGEGRGEGADRTPLTPTTPRSSTRPGELSVYSQGQNIWRYHPERRIYEIFAEGGGNAFGVEFDDKGRLFSGHNGGDTRGFHYMQGAYLRKGFEKHGELSNPYAFGYFPHMDGTKGERFSHTFLIYHGGALPPRYEGKLFGCEPLQGRIVLSEITPDGSTFKTRDLKRVVTSSDSWFRPVDIKAGPDGAIYIADWYDRNVAHTRNQEGNIDPGNGRIYRLKKKGAKAEKPRSLHVEDEGFLKWHPGLRQAMALEPASSNLRRSPLQAFWIRNALRNLRPSRPDERVAALSDSSPDVQVWAIRLLGDDGTALEPDLRGKLNQLAAASANLEVRAQLACTAKRLPAADALPIVRNLILSSSRSSRGNETLIKRSQNEPPHVGSYKDEDDARDPRLPLLLWWAIESKCESDRDAVLTLFEDSPLWTRPIVEQHLLDRLMRRFAAAGTRRDLLTCARLLQLSPDAEHSRILMRGFEEAFKGRSVAGLPDELITAMARHHVSSDAFKLRTGDPAALTRALAAVTDAKADKQRRQEFIDVLGEVRPPAALDALLRVADDERDATLRKSALTALLGYDDARIPATVLKDYSAYAPEVRPAALTLLASRAAWSLALAQTVGAGRIKAQDVPLETVRQLQRHKSDKLAALLTKHWPNAGRPTSEAMQQQIAKLSTVLRDGKGDPYSGQKLFNTACASCHTLFARGGHVGPDLTAYQRSDLDALLLGIVNPSAEVREGFESFNVETKDDRSLTGFLVERDARIVVLRGLDGQNITLRQEDIAEMKPAGLSLMPEGLLDPLTDQQVRDLFAYVRSTQPLAN